MSPGRPQVERNRLALLSVAVLAVHLLLLHRPGLWHAPRQGADRPLMTRVLWSELPAPEAAPAAPPAPQQPAALASKSGRAAPRAATAVGPAIPQRLQTTAAAPAASAPASIQPSQQAAAEPAPALALAIPRSVRLLYEVTGLSRGKDWKLQGELLWRHDGSDYEATLASPTPLLPSRSQRSTGRITAQGLAPSRFSDKGRSEQATHFERDSGALVFSSNAPQVALSEGVQDRLSVFLQLASMVAADPGKFPAGTDIEIVTAGTREAQPWIFTVEGDQSLLLPGGEAATRKLVRLPRREYDLRVELWLGIAVDYVPLRIRLTQANGDYADLQWSSTDRP